VRSQACDRALPAVPTPCEGVTGEGVFPWLNANVNVPVSHDGAGPDQAGRPVPAVYAVSRPQPLDGVTVIWLSGAATPAVANHSAAAHAASIETMARVVASLIAFSHIVRSAPVFTRTSR
jgi:hypothetical protein